MCSLTKLERLDLRGNVIADLDSLRKMSTLSTLKSIKLEGNPVCQSVSHYIEILFASIDSLLEVDGRLVSYMCDEEYITMILYQFGAELEMNSTPLKQNQMRSALAKHTVIPQRFVAIILIFMCI